MKNRKLFPMNMPMKFYLKTNSCKCNKDNKERNGVNLITANPMFI